MLGGSKVEYENDTTSLFSLEFFLHFKVTFCSFDNWKGSSLGSCWGSVLNTKREQYSSSIKSRPGTMILYAVLPKALFDELTIAYNCMTSTPLSWASTCINNLQNASGAFQRIVSYNPGWFEAKVVISISHTIWTFIFKRSCYPTRHILITTAVSTRKLWIFPTTWLERLRSWLYHVSKLAFLEARRDIVPSKYASSPFILVVLAFSLQVVKTCFERLIRSFANLKSLVAIFCRALQSNHCN